MTALKKVLPVPSSLHGRCAGLLFQRGPQGLAPINLYFPPRPWDNDGWGHYRATVDHMMDWLVSALQSIPAQVTPFIMTDMNDDFATQFDDMVGEHRCLKQNYTATKFVDTCSGFHSL